MRTGAVLALLCIALLSGCTEPEEAPLPQGPPGDGPAAVSAFDLARGNSFAGAPPGPFTNATGLTEIHWATATRNPVLVAEVSLHLGERNSCHVDAEAAGSAYGMHELVLAEGSAGAAWMVASTAAMASGHAGPVGTGPVLGASVGAASGRVGASGPLVLTLVVLGPERGGAPDLDDHSAGFTVACDRPFDLLGARAGSEALLGDASSWSGGAGVSSFPGPGAHAADGAAFEFASPVVRAAADGFGDHAGRIALAHPGGEAEWTFLPDSETPWQAVGGPAGEYRFTVAQASGPFAALWTAAWGLDGPLDLRPGLLAESPISRD